MTTNFTISFANQPMVGSQVTLVPIIERTILAAGAWLASYVQGLGTIDVIVNFDSNIPTMSGGSLSSEIVKSSKVIAGKTYTMLQEGVAVEWMTGRDVNGVASDLVINIGTTNLERWYAFDSTLASASDIPSNKTDAFRVILHELIHGMGLNGFLCNGSTGAFASVYDQFFVSLDGRSYFTGVNAQNAFGGLVPVSNAHLGDAISFSNNMLTGSQTLMSYDSVPNGQRISLDPVLIGVLRDLGYTVRDTQASFAGNAGLINTAHVGTTADGYQLLTTLDLSWLIFQNRAEYSYLLQNIQRLEFTDKHVALDLQPSEHAGQTAEFIGILAPEFINNPAVVGYVLGLFDAGMMMPSVCQMAIDMGLVQSLAGSNSIASLVTVLFKNVIGLEPSVAQVKELAAYMDGSSGGYTPADFMAIVANSELNQTHIGLVGLQQSGLEYLV